MDQKHQSEQSSDSDDQNTLTTHNQESSSSIYITDPSEYLNFALKDKKIKVMDQCNPISPNVYLKDISLHKKGPLEDKIYSKVDKYYINIRRGNTLCQIYHPQQINNKQQTYDLFFCRRGMKKFYDLQPDYLKVTASLSTHHRLMRNRIFQLLDKDLQSVGSVYHLYCLFKENGQHCQISYVKALECWLFASKNVAVLAKSPQDLEKHYHKQRFYWAKLIGIQFFRILQKMSEEQKASFQQDIQGYTLLGEHCGNEQHQHITKYGTVEIIFYGLVKNTGFDHCQPVEQCKQLLKKYGLRMSQTKEWKNLTDKNKIFSTMWYILKEVAEGTMAKEGEGSVMYIVAEKGGKQKTIGMCKLKTCEYLIYRKLREMLKLNVARKGMTANSFEKYKFEIEQLVQHYFKPPKSLQFYFQLGEQAFKECGSNTEISQNYLRYKFVDFISKFEQNHKNKPVSLPMTAKRILLVCLPRISNSIEKYCKANQLQVQCMYRAGKPITRNTIHILYLIPRLLQPFQNNCTIILPKYSKQQINQCITQLQECKDLTKSQLITFIKSEDKLKSVLMLQEKIEHFRKNCKESAINLIQTESSEEQLLQAIQTIFKETEIITQSNSQKQQNYMKHFILPLLIPGSGKSTLSKQILNSKQSKYLWKRIDSDQIRRDFMELKDKVDLNQQARNKQLFIETKEQALHKFIEELVKEAETKPINHQCVFVDRIFSPYNIEETIDTLLKCQKDYIKIHILTQSYVQTKINDKTYPYSINYLLTCLKRCLERTDHQTMPNDPYAVAKIVMKFYQMMGNFNSKSISKLSPQKINFVSLPLIAQSEQTKCINQVLKKKLGQCLSLVQPGRQAKDNSCFIQLVETLYKFGEFKDSKDLERYAQLASCLQKAIQNSG